VARILLSRLVSSCLHADEYVGLHTHASGCRRMKITQQCDRFVVASCRLRPDNTTRRCFTASRASLSVEAIDTISRMFSSYSPVAGGEALPSSKNLRQLRGSNGSRFAGSAILDSSASNNSAASLSPWSYLLNIRQPRDVTYWRRHLR